MKTVFLVQHSYELESCDETKLIGVYSSLQEAQAAVERLKIQPGFRDRVDDFHIGELEINKDHWTEGFSTMTTIQVKDINGNWKTVSAACLADGNYEIVEKYEDELLGEFHDLDIVKCEARDGELYATDLIKRNSKH
jgi:hypothetical protein